MNLGYVIIYVDDCKKASEFYTQALGLTTHYVCESGLYVEMSTGATRLAFANSSLLHESTGLEYGISEKKSMEIGFTTDDVSKMYHNAVQNGAIPVKEPVTKPWGQTVSYVQDPFGTLIEICSVIH